jgi:hypothetical protein
MNYAYRFHPFAIDDYQEAFTWYETKQEGLGERFLKAFRLKLNTISAPGSLWRQKQ